MRTAEIEILNALDRHKVPYLIIGGHAVYAHGYRRETEDLDILWQRTSESEQALCDALLEIGASYLTNEIDPMTKIEKAVPVSLAYVRAHHLMMLWTNAGFLDVFAYVPGYPEEDVTRLFESAIEVNGRKFASLHWLRRMKEAAGRTKDRLDLENLPEA